jgi:hypothetical protein
MISLKDVFKCSITIKKCTGLINTKLREVITLGGVGKGGVMIKNEGQRSLQLYQ